MSLRVKVNFSRDKKTQIRPNFETDQKTAHKSFRCIPISVIVSKSQRYITSQYLHLLNVVFIPEFKAIIVKVSVQVIYMKKSLCKRIVYTDKEVK